MIPEIGACGVFCGACPSFGKSCEGCSSTNRKQKRQSKFSCQIRQCCYEEKGLMFCADCDEFPCKLINKRLIKGHKNNPQYTYRHELPTSARLMKEMDLDKYLELQKQRWTCKSCGGTVYIYHYECESCGKEQMVTYPKDQS